MKQTEGPGINTTIYGHLIFDEGAKHTQRRKDSPVPSCWDSWILTCKRMKLGPYIIPLTEVNGLKTNAKLATPRRTYRSKAP